MLKDKAYWQVYNQKRKAYLAHKARQRRAKEKSIQAERIQLESIQPFASERIQPSPSIQLNSPYTTERIQPARQEERIQPQKLVDQTPMSTTESIQPQLWSNHYSVKKPYCHSCEQKGIPESQYAFCTLTKKNSLYFNHIYACNVYHWTLYQGQGKVEGGNM